MNFIIVVPVRFFSKRLPGKALASIHGKPMIIRVLENALNSNANTVIVATDSMRIAKVIKSQKFSNLSVYITKLNHQSGTERIAEIVVHYKIPDDQIIVHLQGDEPLISTDMIHELVNAASLINITDNMMVTLATPISSYKEACNSDIVKVVIDSKNYALYFSRSMIPWINICNVSKDRDNNMKKLSDFLLCHMGVYLYKAKFLHNYVNWDVSPLERLEKLEQLRVLWNQGLIYVSIVNTEFNVSVNTLESLEQVNILFKNNI
ncbi:3-deoxy-manno-octulosonate cytidylyltransferase [Candidatus Blochmannia ocreatus (nom. nud.)]|uniref:3-deoxy-manno-octulosonate cytidylyltransferase n=1 Tax=Candidatus Blochmannia ocreatus (nom. nud.) TaxID=251538 RepID=A0ABY4SSC2_9ENTR|nr:3-deoxy-manno-octulosonate cytidylyltransferase [Candidatus Blochmannia ocreatus]URJ24884.1 3-deoxy-manno-octulosonate cytidylyltransferase [Candidatus Blochmannia ocreatus]